MKCKRTQEYMKISPVHGSKGSKLSKWPSYTSSVQLECNNYQHSNDILKDLEQNLLNVVWNYSTSQIGNTAKGEND